jgi:hypothetical protein
MNTVQIPLPITYYPEWESEYKPKSHIQPQWYNKLTTPITIEELQNTINSRSNKSAPGLTGIPYLAFKKLSKNSLLYINDLLNNILQTGQIPSEWKSGSIYPIPKPKDWENNINIIRPITLLESIRKIFTKILNDRLTNILSSHLILSPHNWAALPGSSTQEPIHILQAIIEDAKQHDQQAWILSLDMSKAYDSVHIPRLIQAMHRIKIPQKIIQLITNIFDNRSNQVITPFGPTEKYLVQDGIDQGDTISPVLWRIFYDPLITKLDQSELGYSLQTSSHADIRDKPTITTCTTTCTAFMDDTTLISNNAANIQQICDISSTFFQLNDIQINTDKSHLIVINKKEHQTRIKVQQHNITVLPPSQAIRILGVWHNGKGDKNH